MIIGIGTDICENKRVRKMINRYGDRFLKRVFMPEEIEYCQKRKQPSHHFAARFALKEAFIKSLNLKRDLSLSYRDVGLTGGFGKKEIQLTGKIKEMVNEKKVSQINFSISHARKYSCAFVVLENEFGKG